MSIYMSVGTGGIYFKFAESIHKNMSDTANISIKNIATSSKLITNSNILLYQTEILDFNMVLIILSLLLTK